MHLTILTTVRAETTAADDPVTYVYSRPDTSGIWNHSLIAGRPVQLLLYRSPWLTLRRRLRSSCSSGLASVLMWAWYLKKRGSNNIRGTLQKVPRKLIPLSVPLYKVTRNFPYHVYRLRRQWRHCENNNLSQNENCRQDWGTRTKSPGENSSPT